MSVFKILETRLAGAKRDLETFSDQIQQNYRRNTTPSASSISEVKSLTCPSHLLASAGAPGNSLFSGPALRQWIAAGEAPASVILGFPHGWISSILWLSASGEKIPENNGLLSQGLERFLDAPAADPENPDIRRIKLARLSWSTGLERQRVEREKGPSFAVPFLIAEAHIAIALGDRPRAAELTDHLLGNLREAAAARALLPLQRLVDSGDLTSKDLQSHQGFFSIVSTLDCGQKLVPTPLFFKLNGPDQLEKLQDLVRLGAIAEHRALSRKALLAYDEPRRLYHDAHIALLEGNTPKARVELIEFKEKSFGNRDPEIVLMREESREILRTFSLQEVDQLIAFSEGIAAQRRSNRYGWTIEAQLTGDSQELGLKRIRNLLESGKSDTLEEAYARARRQGTVGNFKGALVPLFLMGTKEGLERLSQPESRKQYLLEIAESINNREGSYGLAAKMLQDVFQDQLHSALRECPKDKLDAIRADIDREAIEKAVEESRGALEAAFDQRVMELRDKDPQSLERQFGSGGPTQEQRNQKIGEMLATETERRVALTMGYHLLRERHESGELKKAEPIADRAWELFNDTLDPLHEIFNVSHATEDVLKKEALFTLVSLPAGLGAGALARYGMSGTTLVTRLAVQGGFRALAAEGLIVGAGALAESLTSVGLNAALKGEKITPGKAGLEFLSSLAGGLGSRAWSRAAKALHLEEEALQELVIKGANRAEIAGRKIGAFAGPLAISVGNATLFGEIGLVFQDEPVDTSFGERLFGNLVKALVNPRLEKVVHFLSGNQLEHLDAHIWNRLKQAETVYFDHMERSATHATVYEMGQAASALHEAGWKEEDIMTLMELDPSLSQLVMPAKDDAASLVSGLTKTPG